MNKTIEKVSVYKKYIFGEMSKNKKFGIEDLDHLVGSLSTSQAKLLCKYLSGFRNNQVYNFVKEGPDNWKVLIVDINNIYVDKVNNGVNALLEKNEWCLDKICLDKDISSHEEFKSQGKIDNRLMSFISKKVGNKYKIVDGIHRAIRLSCDGKKEFELIYY
jgi:hypothetical protein